MNTPQTYIEMLTQELWSLPIVWSASGLNDNNFSKERSKQLLARIADAKRQAKAA